MKRKRKQKTKAAKRLTTVLQVERSALAWRRPVSDIDPAIAFAWRMAA